MKRPRPARTTQPLPRYTRRKRLANGSWSYFFEVPRAWAAAGCTVASEPLGTDYAAACARAESVLLPALDSWRSSGASDIVPKAATPGTLDWVFALYRDDRRFKKLSKSTRKTHLEGFQTVGQYVLKDGRRLGAQALTKITPALADKLLEALLKVSRRTKGPNGAEVVVEVERRTTANHAMKSCRRAWNIAARLKPDVVPKANPFARMGLESNSKPTPTATYADLQRFVTACDTHGRSSLGTAALIAWEWLQREEDIFGTLAIEHYRPKLHPDAVQIIHAKTRQEAWFPLYDRGKVPLYSQLQERLDAIKRERIAGPMLVRDWPDKARQRQAQRVPLPWPTPKGDLSFMRHEVKRMIRVAGLRGDLTFTSFRHGGMTEGADAELTDRELLAQSRHTTPKVLPRYAKKTLRQVASGARKRLASRETEDDVGSTTAEAAQGTNPAWESE